MSDIGDILRALAKTEAKVVLIGGVAMRLHGASYTTEDIDFAYERTRENAKRIVAALAPFTPRPRGFPTELPFIFDAQTLMSGAILTLDTSAGDVDLLAEIVGVGSFAEIDALAETLTIDDLHIRVLSPEGLLRTKRAAGRPKDAEGIIALEALIEAQEESEKWSDQISPIVAGIYAELQDDQYGLFQVKADVVHSLELTYPEDIRVAVMSVVRALLGRGDVVAGNFRRTANLQDQRKDWEFVPCVGSLDEIASRIEQTWANSIEPGGVWFKHRKFVPD